MSNYDVNKLVGARVLFPVRLGLVPHHEEWGTIIEVLSAFQHEEKEVAITHSLFRIAINDGKSADDYGQNFSKIEADDEF